MPEIVTERLIIRREKPEDYLDAFAWSGDEEVYRYLKSNACKKPEDMLPWLERLDQNSREAFVMILRSREDNRAIGTVGLFYDREEDLWELAYNIRRDAWGRGYATEAARAMMDYVIREFGAHTFHAECARENYGSARVMEHLGMRYVRDSSYSKHDGTVFASKIYRLELRERN